MKNLLLLAVLVSLPLLLGGCGEKHEGEKHKGVNLEELEISGDALNEIAYHKGSPYTGKSYKLHPNGQKYTETNYKDGKEDGLVLTWHENGQKHGEGNYKDGKKISGKWWNSKGEPVDSREEALK